MHAIPVYHHECVSSWLSRAEFKNVLKLKNIQDFAKGGAWGKFSTRAALKFIYKWYVRKVDTHATKGWFCFLCFLGRDRSIGMFPKRWWAGGTGGSRSSAIIFWPGEGKGARCQQLYAGASPITFEWGVGWNDGKDVPNFVCVCKSCQHF